MEIKLILEGGNIGNTNSAIPKEFLQSNIDNAINLLNFNNINYKPVGNIYKKYLGDIDLAIDINEIVSKIPDISIETFWNDIEKYLSKLNIREYKVQKGFSQFSIVLPLLDNNGVHINAIDINGRNLFEKGLIQIDFMVGDLHWMKSALYSNPNSKYKSVYRNIFLAEMLRFIIFIIKNSDIKRKLQINWKIGVQLVDFVVDKGKRKKIRVKKVMGDMDKLSKFLFNSSYTFDKIDTYEKLYDAFEKDFRFKKYSNDIIKGFKETLIKNKLSLPDNLNIGVSEMIDSELKNILKESQYIIDILGESIASEKAKRLGLVHLGFGNYGPKKGGPTTMRSYNGKLIKVGKKVKKNTIKKIGITDIKKVSGSDNIFTYRYNNNNRKILLTKAEYKSFVDKSITIKQIIEKRIELEKKKKSKVQKKKTNVQKIK